LLIFYNKTYFIFILYHGKCLFCDVWFHNNFHCLFYIHCVFTINSRCVDFIFAISSIADFEYTVNLIGCDPGAKSRTLKSFTFLTSIPGSAPIALDISEPFLVTNKTLFPTFCFYL